MGDAPPATGHSICTSGTTSFGSASMLKYVLAPSPEPLLIKPIPSRLAGESSTNSFRPSMPGVSGPPKCTSGTLLGASAQNVPNQPAYIGVLPFTVSDSPYSTASLPYFQRRRQNSLCLGPLAGVIASSL